MSWKEVNARRYPKLTEAQYAAQWVAKVMKRITITDNGCWLWQGPQSYNGYGTYSYRGRHTIVHRKMYEIANDVKLGRWIYACHKCDERACANPAHVFEGTPRENQIDMSRKKRAAGQDQTHCHRGHEFTEENTYWSDRGHTKARNCRTCHRARFRIKAGWPEDLAYSMGTVPHGYRPVNATFPRKRKAA